MDELRKEISFVVISSFVAIIGAIVIGFRKVFVVVVDQFIKRIRQKNYLRGLRETADFLSSLEELDRLVMVERYGLFEGKDSGGLPQAGKPYTVRCLKGKTSVRGKVSPQEKYSFDIQIDTAYINLLTKIVEEGVIRIKTSEMEPGLLKDLHESEGVSDTLIFFLGIVDYRLLFLGVSRYADREFGKTDQIGINLVVSKLRAKLGENKWQK